MSQRAPPLDMHKLSADGIQQLNKAVEATKAMMLAALAADPSAAAGPAMEIDGVEAHVGAPAEQLASAQREYLDALSQVKRTLQAVHDAEGKAARQRTEAGTSPGLEQLQAEADALRRQVADKDAVLDEVQRSVERMQRDLNVWDEEVDNL